MLSFICDGLGVVVVEVVVVNLLQNRGYTLSVGFYYDISGGALRVCLVEIGGRFTNFNVLDLKLNEIE